MVPGNLNPVSTMACGGLALVFIVFGSEALVCFVISARLLTSAPYTSIILQVVQCDWSGYIYFKIIQICYCTQLQAIIAAALASFLFLSPSTLNSPFPLSPALLFLYIFSRYCIDSGYFHLFFVWI